MPKEISRSALAEAILSDHAPIVVEALPRNNYRSGHIPTAQPLPLDELAKLAPQIAPDRGRAIIVYCSSITCPNSHQAAGWLSDHGYDNVSVYSGGKADWKDAGLRLEV